MVGDAVADAALPLSPWARGLPWVRRQGLGVRHSAASTPDGPPSRRQLLSQASTDSNAGAIPRGR